MQAESRDEFGGHEGSHTGGLSTDWKGERRGGREVLKMIPDACLGCVGGGDASKMR